MSRLRSSRARVVLPIPAGPKMEITLRLLSSSQGISHVRSFFAGPSIPTGGRPSSLATRGGSPRLEVAGRRCLHLQGSGSRMRQCSSENHSQLESCRCIRGREGERGRKKLKDTCMDLFRSTNVLGDQASYSVL